MLSRNEVETLELRLAELSAQVRAYPTPIARCDEQLAALLEERGRVYAALERLAAAPSEGELCKWESDGGIRAA
ncbi:MAG TPA: hypothetical protein VLX30_02345 [Burkholderiales bacterium]|nr:hypothetical protein [Burkholderiales bacterium]